MSATPIGERTIVTSIPDASDQRAKSLGLLLPEYSGTAEQIVLVSGNRVLRNSPKSAGGSVNTSPLRSLSYEPWQIDMRPAILEILTEVRCGAPAAYLGQVS